MSHHEAVPRGYDADNHLFFPGTNQSTPADYDPPQHVDPAVIDDIARWLAPARDSSPGSGSGKNQTRTRTAYRRRHRGDTKLPAFLANMRSSAPHRPQRFRQDHDHWEISGLAAEAMVTLQRAQSASCHGSRSAYCAHPGHPLVAHGISPKQRRGTGGFSGTSRPCLRRKPENQAGSARIWP
jgi:hypothetical protein